MTDTNPTSATPLSAPAAIRSRRSTRHFEDRALTDAQIDELIALTVAAPSSWNFQPWRIVVVRDPEQREKLAGACFNQPQVREAPVSFVFAISHTGWRDNMDEVIRTAADAGAWDEKFQEIMRNAAPGFQEGLGDQLREYNTKDALIAATHLALAAESLGLSSCFMNGYVEDAVKAVIGAEGNDDIGVSVVIPIGYAKVRGSDPGRLPLARTVFDGALDRPWGA